MENRCNRYFRPRRCFWKNAFANKSKDSIDGEFNLDRKSSMLCATQVGTDGTHGAGVILQLK